MISRPIYLRRHFAIEIADHTQQMNVLVIRLELHVDGALIQHNTLKGSTIGCLNPLPRPLRPLPECDAEQNKPTRKCADYFHSAAHYTSALLPAVDTRA